MIAACALLATALPAQPAQPAPRWDVRADAFTDLWFAGLALAGDQGPGPIPLYAPDARWHPGERLRRATARLRQERRRVGALDVLHVVPLHLAGTDPLVALGAIGTAFTGGPPPAAAARLAEVAAAIAEAVPRATRPIVAEFAAALADEWNASRRDEWLTGEAARAATARALDARWASRFVPVLRAFLDRRAAAGGTLLIAGSVGAEGRVLGDAPATPVVVIVGRSGPPDAPLLALTRELTFPIVQAVLERSPGAVPADRAAAARLSHTMAVRAGAMLLERDPELSAAYERFYLDAAGRRDGSLAAAFALDGALERDLRGALRELSFAVVRP